MLSGGREAAYFNGLASATTMRGGSVLAVSSGGTARGATVRAGGTLQVFSGGVASGTTLSNYGIQTVSSGGMARGTVVSKGGFQETSLGGTTVGVMVLSGGYQDVGGRPARTTVLLPGGELDLTAAPFTAIGAAVLSPVNNVLTIVEGSGATTEQLSSDYTGDVFHLADDGHGGTAVTQTAAAPASAAARASRRRAARWRWSA